VTFGQLVKQMLTRCKLVSVELTREDLAHSTVVRVKGVCGKGSGKVYEVAHVVDDLQRDFAQRDMTADKMLYLLKLIDDAMIQTGEGGE